MVVQPGVRLGRYQIEALIGRGGMGEVYRARDTTLDREVAIKALPESLATDRERLARFEREARLLASLNHPHIATVHGLERNDGASFLVMELVLGETLAECLSRGPIPLEEALPLFRQMAEALEAAHGKGVVHRDLKPSNVKVTPEGNVKVLDFGLAKALDDDPREGELSESPTNTYGATRAGVVLGTASYMSPEQARGKTVDDRTDIWALGAVMYEALTGKKAFPGETASDVIAAILKNEPDWDVVPGATRTLLRRCLQKDPTRRLHDAADVRIEIEEATTATEAGVSMPSVIPWAPWAIAMAALGIAALSLWAPWREAPSRPVVRTRLDFPDVLPVPARAMKALAISPDGARVVYAGIRAGESKLFLRELSGVEASAIPGTEGGYGPFFSPDGKWLAFFAGGQMKKVRTEGGPVQGISSAPNPRGGTWGEGDVIVYEGAIYAGLSRVSANGGATEPLTRTEPGEDHLSPRFLPGGRAVLMVSRSTSLDSIIQVVDLETGVRKTVVEGGDSPTFLASGHLVYNQAGTLVALPFDPVTKEAGAQAVAITEGVFMQVNNYSQYDVARDGTLVYLRDAFLRERQLVSVDRKGTPSPITPERRPYGMPRLSPDGKRLALLLYEGMRARSIWLYEIGRDSLTRLPFERGFTSTPLWTPDGRSLAFLARLPEYQLFRGAADGSQEVEPLTEPSLHATYAHAWTPDGRTLVFSRFDPSTGFDLWTLALDGERKPSPWLRTRFNERGGELSPDGRFLAYMSDESGQDEIYVQPFPDSGARWKISTNGGTEPCWARSGRELFYREEDQMMSVGIETGPAFSASKPVVLFSGRFETSFLVTGTRFYDVFPDGEHFIMVRSEDSSGATELNLVQNWSEEVERLVPTK